jgi:hypothetical protein
MIGDKISDFHPVYPLILDILILTIYPTSNFQDLARQQNQIPYPEYTI